jgi:hypothetical protein
MAAFIFPRYQALLGSVQVENFLFKYRHMHYQAELGSEEKQSVIKMPDK